MATVYKVEVVSHRINYSEEDIKKWIEKALKKNGNEIQVTVKKEK